jgi:hypothetical protein
MVEAEVQAIQAARRELAAMVLVVAEVAVAVLLSMALLRVPAVRVAQATCVSMRPKEKHALLHH